MLRIRSNGYLYSNFLVTSFWLSDCTQDTWYQSPNSLHDWNWQICATLTFTTLPIFVCSKPWVLLLLHQWWLKRSTAFADHFKVDGAASVRASPDEISTTDSIRLAFIGSGKKVHPASRNPSISYRKTLNCMCSCKLYNSPTSGLWNKAQYIITDPVSRIKFRKTDHLPWLDRLASAHKMGHWMDFAQDPLPRRPIKATN